MNGTYYPNPTFPTSSLNDEENLNNNNDKTLNTIDDFLYNYKEKELYILTTFNEEKYVGKLKYIYSDYIIIRNIEKEKWYIIPLKNINIIELNTNL